MAIEDSTSYELTGAQVKDLANKIKGKAADNTFVGATSAAPGSKGLVPEPQAGDNTKFLRGDGAWASNYVIHYGTFTATTDSNGFAAVPKTMVTPSTGMVIGASTTSIACFTLAFNDNDLGRYTLRVTGWDLSSLGGRRVDFKIAYILY